MSAPKDGIVIYKDGFPDDFKEAMTERLASYWKIVNHSTIHSRDLGPETLQRVHEDAYQEFIKGPLYIFPDRADSQARADYFKRCDEICNKLDKSPTDHVLTTFAGMAAISVLQAQDVGEYIIEYGGLTGREIVIRSRSIASSSPLCPRETVHVCRGSAESAFQVNQTTESQQERPEANRASEDKDANVPEPRTPREGVDGRRVSTESPVPAFSDTGLFSPVEQHRDNLSSPEDAMYISDSSTGTPAAQTESSGPPHSEPPATDTATPEPPSFLGLVGKKYRSTVFDIDDMEFTIEDCAVTIVRSKRLYVLRYRNDEEKYVNSEQLGRILEKSIAV